MNSRAGLPKPRLIYVAYGPRAMTCSPVRSPIPGSARAARGRSSWQQSFPTWRSGSQLWTGMNEGRCRDASSRSGRSMQRGEERFRVIKRLERLDLALGVGARQSSPFSNRWVVPRVGSQRSSAPVLAEWTQPMPRDETNELRVRRDLVTITSCIGSPILAERTKLCVGYSMGWVSASRPGRVDQVRQRRRRRRCRSFVSRPGVRPADDG
jgi:hypothetical protein